MARSPIRRLGISDLMILIAATAMGCWVLQGPMNETRGFPSLTAVDWWDCLIAANDCATFVWPLLACWNAAFLIIRLRSPRPRRPYSQPGMVACGIAALVLAIESAAVPLLLYEIAESGHGEDAVEAILTSYNNSVSLQGIGVLGGWVALIANRRWRPEAGGIDRIGRTIGVLWIATTFVTLFSFMNPMR